MRRWLARYVPERVSMLVGGAGGAGAVLDAGRRGALRGFIRLSDRSFQALDALIEPQFPAPSDPMQAGSAESLVNWEELGRAGREFVVSGPTAEEISAFTGREAKKPIRVYAGLNSAEELEERADLVLREMIRVGAFDRSVLIVAVPTGTGWMDPAAMDTLEYLHGGDTAIVAMQYSYLTSWISLLVEPGYGSAAGREIFRTVYGHWTSLPRDQRPKLYLQGLSLGSYGSEQSFRLHEVLADPFQGAVWSGPPFPSPTWVEATRNRNPGTPEWLPRYGDGSVIRFTNQENALDIPGAAWGPMRFVYLQYASDPITFFDPHSLWHKPDWMQAAGGAGRVAGAALVSGGQLPAARARHGDRAAGADRARALLCARALHRRLGGGDRSAGLDGGRDRAAEGEVRRGPGGGVTAARRRWLRWALLPPGWRRWRRWRWGERALALPRLDGGAAGAGRAVGAAGAGLSGDEARGGGAVSDRAPLLGV